MARLLLWARRGPPFPYPRSVAGAAMALLWMAGGVTILVVSFIPRLSDVNRDVLYVLGTVSPVVSILIFRFRLRLPIAVYPWFLGAGCGVLALLIAAGGGGSVSVSFSFFFMWVVMYALLFFSPLVVAIEVVVAAVAYAVAVVGLRSFTALEPTVLVTVIATMAVVVRSLSIARETSEIDPLTKVANRRGLDRAIDTAMHQAVAEGTPFVLALIDIDHFKQVNDLLGHRAGDLVLQRVVEPWRRALRSTDFVGRFGGDEFIVILQRCSAQAAGPILELLRSTATDEVTCSIGAAAFRIGESATVLIGRADVALYSAKRLGRNRVAWDCLDVAPGAPTVRQSR